MEEAAALKPLAGVRVLDFTALPPGGFCTVMLADLGAEIIRVEPPARKGKPSLVIGQVALSRGKRSLTLDLRDSRSVAVLERLITTVDVVVENAKPGSMEARGFGYKQAREARPSIVWCAITGFGQSGPYADHAAHDLSFLAHSGLLGALTEDRSWQPALSLALQAGAQAAVIGIQAALFQSVRTGEGAFVDISLSEAATSLLTCGINPLSENPMMLPATPDRRLYACADGRYVAVACAEPRTWAALCDGLGLPELKPNLHQQEEAASTTQAIAEVLRTRSAAEWVERLAPAGAAVTILNHASELLGDPHVQARGTVVQCAGVTVPACPIRIEGSEGQRSETATAAPRKVGEDTDDVLASSGFSTSEIAVLVHDGIV